MSRSVGKESADRPLLPFSLSEEGLRKDWDVYCRGDTRGRSDMMQTWWIARNGGQGLGRAGSLTVIHSRVKVGSRRCKHRRVWTRERGGREATSLQTDEGEKCHSVE